MKVRIRLSKPEDTDFIFDSWLKSFRKSRYAGVVPNHLYFDTYRTTIEQVIGRGAKLWVACSLEDENQILGWMCTEATPDKKPVIHYLYVKDPYMKMGIADQLLAGLDGLGSGFYTFNYHQITDAVSERWPDQRWSWVPEIARRK